MAQAKTIQLLRSSAISANLEAAKQVLLGNPNAEPAVAAKTANDGELVLVRYYADAPTNSVVKSIIGIYHKNPDLPTGAPAGWTIIQDITSSSEGLQELQNEIDAIESAVGLGNDGAYTGYTSDGIVGTTTTLDGTVDAIITYIKGLDKDARANATTDGKVVVTVAQADGKVSETDANLTDVVMAGYSKTSNTGAIAATDTLEEAFSKVENALAAGSVHSNDQSITVSSDATNGGKNIEVNVDGTTIVKDSSSHAIKSNLTVTQLTSTEITALNDANVKEAYKLIYATDSNRTAIGDVVKVYKDSALQLVYLGTANDTINATTGVITEDTTITDKQSLNFKYLLADGTYSLTKIDVSKFLTQSEFGDGLSVSNAGVVSVKTGNGLEINSTSKAVDVKIDSTSEKVITAYGSTNTQSDVLSVGADGVKVSNIQTAIDAKVGTLDVTDTAVEGQYVSAVNETDGKVSMTRANVADAVLTGYSKGTAPASLDVAATDDVKTAIAKLEHQVDAAESAASNAVSGLDGTADATSVTSGNVPTADFQVLTKVVETDGVVQAVGATNGSTSATLKKLAATGAAADVSIADAGNLITATTVEGALQEIAGKANGALQSVSGSNAITVGTEDSSHDQAISLKLDNSTGNNVTSGTVTDMLTITNNGLAMNDTWDCGTF